MSLLSLLLACQCGEPAGPTPFEAMVYADRVGDTSPFGVRVRQRGAFVAIETTPRTDAPWIEVRATGEGDARQVDAVDVVLPTPESIELLKKYWIHPAKERVVAQAPTGLSAWVDAPAKLTIWYPANSSLVMLWEPVETGAFTPRLTSRPHHPLGMLMPFFAECAPHGLSADAPPQSITPFSIGPFDSAPTLTVTPDVVRWRARGEDDTSLFEALSTAFTLDLGEPVDGRWSCVEGEGAYTLQPGEDGWVEVVLTRGRR